jgi:hypothetical protein
VVVVEENEVVVVGGRNGRREVRLAASAVNRAISVQTTTPPTHDTVHSPCTTRKCCHWERASHVHDLSA